MRSRFAYMSLILVFILALSGCSSIFSSHPSVPPEQTAGTTAPTTRPTEPDLPDPTQAPAYAEVPYLQQIDGGQPVYQGPGYDYELETTVPDQGTYTIVEEQLDPEGNLWGRLKSGIGWVDLTRIREKDSGSMPISADYFWDAPVTEEEFHHYSCGDTQYGIPILFRAHGMLRDVELFSFFFCEDGYYPGEVLFSLGEMTPEKPLLAELEFPGDMTTYGLRFVDKSGNTHVFSIFISGKDGELILKEEASS